MNLSPQLGLFIERMKMNKFSKLASVLVLVGLVGGLSGCASLDGITQKNMANKSSGVIYGVVFQGIAAAKNEVNEVCSAIKNADERCLDKDKYKTVFVVSKVGYSDGPVGLIALVEKTTNTGAGCVSGSSDCTYLKVQANPGKMATVLEVASIKGDGKCHWSGMPRIGGTVCDAYNYDYRKDFTGVVR
jgi:hypothetical protein